MKINFEREQAAAFGRLKELQRDVNDSVSMCEAGLWRDMTPEEFEKHNSYKVNETKRAIEENLPTLIIGRWMIIQRYE